MRFLECLKSAGKILSLACKGFMHFQILCYVLERWIRTQHQLLLGKKSWVGSKIHHSTELWTQLTENRWNSSGIFSQDSPHCSSSGKVQEFMTKMCDPSQFKGRIIFLSMFNDLIWRSEDNERECSANATLVSSFFFCKKIPSRTLVILRAWIRKEVVFYLHWQTTRRMGQSRWLDDDQIQRKRTPSFPSHESIVSVNAQKQRRWTIIYSLLCRWGYDWNCFSHNHFCKSAQYLRSSLRFVWRIQSLPCKNGENRFGCLCQQVRWWQHLHLRLKFLRKKIYCKSTKNEWKGHHNKIVWLKFVLMQDSWKQLKSDNTSWQSTLTSSHNLQIQWHVVSTLCHEMNNLSSDLKGWIRGTPRLDPCWKSQPVTCKVNVEWKLELHLWTKTILTRGSEFLMDWTCWSQTWSTKSTTATSRKPLKRRRKYLLLQADRRLKQNLEDLPLLAHLQGLNLFLKEHGLILKLEDDLRNDFENSQHWSDEMWKSKWQMAEATRKDFNIELTRQDKKFFISELLRSFITQSHWSYTAGHCVDSNQFLRVRLSYRMCSQFSLHHKFRIDTGRAKFEQKTDGILHSRGSHEQRTQRSVWNWL